MSTAVAITVLPAPVGAVRPTAVRQPSRDSVGDLVLVISQRE